MALPDLPITSGLPPLLEALSTHNAVVLVAPPGAGKTTVVPLALLDVGWLSGKLVVLEPRRLATRAAAQRMASLRGEKIGETVGYRVRNDTRVGSQTRIEVVTEGVLTRMLQSDPALTGVGLVVFDEFHERSIHADLGLAMALQAQRLFRDDLRLLVMSATLDAATIAEVLGGAPVVEVPGRMHPVETVYRDSPLEGPIEPAVAATVSRALKGRSGRSAAGLDHSAGDVLAFLPGAGEIRRTADRLRSVPPDVDVHLLFGSLGRRQQDAAIAPAPHGRRKVVLATAIAQTSLTIEGVRIVVDSGRMRVPRFNPGTGMTGLATLRVTADVAEQRRGRAGRTAPGVCYRLWTEGEERGLVPRMRPEILEADLAPVMLELAAWGARANELTWPDAPPEAASRQAWRLLRELDAVDGDYKITTRGRRMAKLGVHPRLAHMLVEAAEMGLGPLACDVAALLAERGVLRREGGAPDADVRLQVEALRGAPTVPGSDTRMGHHLLRRGALRRVREESLTLRRVLRVPEKARSSAGDVDRTGEVLALAYPDRIGRRRGPAGGGGSGEAVKRRGATRYLLRNGRGAELPEGQSLAACEWIVVSEIGDSGRDGRIYQAAPIGLEEIETLFEAQIEEADLVSWSASAGRVEGSRRRSLGALVLAEAALRDPDESLMARGLLEGIRASGLRVLPWSSKTRQLHARLRFMHRADPDNWPDVSEGALLESLPEWLGPFINDMRRLDDLTGLDLGAALWTRVGWRRRATLDAVAPSHLEVPSGSRIPLDYTDPDAPALAVRLQEIFGWSETPRIADGNVAVTLRLLSPAQRPVQVTTDLASFWRGAYFEVKKDLKGRYPKHYWPDDPHSAVATRRARPRRPED